MPPRIGFFRAKTSLISTGLLSIAGAITIVAGCGSPNHTLAEGGSGVTTVIPTPAPSTGASPSPVLSPTPLPSAPTGGGSGSLASYYNVFSTLKSTDSFTYATTTSDTFNPDPNSQSVGQTTTNFHESGSDFNFGAFSSGSTTTTSVAITLPVSGQVTVTRETQFALDGVTVTGYRYYSIANNIDTEYGSDSLSSGQLSSSTRYDPGMQTPLSLVAGQKYTQTYGDYETAYASGVVASSYNYSISQSFTYNILSSTNVTTGAGEFTNVAQIQESQSYTLPANAQGNALAEPIQTSGTYTISAVVGILAVSSTTTTGNIQETSTTTNALFTTTETANFSEGLVAATVAGVSYPPGKSASVSRSASVAPPKKLTRDLGVLVGTLRHMASAKRR